MRREEQNKNMVEFFIAFRHIVERKFQSIFSILGVAIAVTVFIVSMTISNGLNKKDLSRIIDLMLIEVNKTLSKKKLI